MRAIVCTGYGPSDVLELQEVKTPIPKDNEVLIKIHATTITAGDVRIRGFAFPPLVWPVVRIMFGITKPKNAILGHEFAGEIESVGKAVTLFKKDDQVFGSTGLGSGTYADFISLSENGTIAIMPKGMTYEEAAAVPVGGLTALYFLRKANIRSGQKVLIHGASGSIGTYAVQISKSMGSEVTGVCSTKNLELVKSLGANTVIDYTREKPLGAGALYDIIFDAVGKASYSEYKHLLAPAGVFTTVAKGVVKERAQDLTFLKELIEAGKLKPVIDRRYAFEQIPEAHRYVEQGHKKGNVIVRMD
ncbi:NAD(P)-dependent alcohol dehydrogenase [bacterium]|nr:NAD(P)-dependent alcohol dehydrogenase [bacterium]